MSTVMLSILSKFLLRIAPWKWRSQIKWLPGVAVFQRKFISTFFDGRAFSHTIDAGPAKGISYLIRLPEDKGIWTGTYECEFAKRLAAAVQPGCVTYDVGSWHGFFAGVMAAQGVREVHVFEPLPANADRVRELIELNPAKSIILHPVALGDRDTEMDLLVMPESSMAKLEMSPFQSKRKSVYRQRVQVRSIDSMVASGEVPPPALMKIDVEGAELLVLTGALQTLEVYRPQIFAEIHSSSLLAAFKSILEREDYSIEILKEAMDQSTDVLQVRAVASLRT